MTCYILVVGEKFAFPVIYILNSIPDKPNNVVVSRISLLKNAQQKDISTDIILIDEVLSVGDERFQRKSFKKISSIIKEPKRSVMIISHDLDTLATLCDKILWLHEGKIKKYGNTEQILNEYGLYMREGIGID